MYAYSRKEVKPTERRQTPGQIFSREKTLGRDVMQRLAGACAVSFTIEITDRHGDTRFNNVGINALLDHIENQPGVTRVWKGNMGYAGAYRIHVNTGAPAGYLPADQVYRFIVDGADDYENELNGQNNGNTYQVIVRRLRG